MDGGGKATVAWTTTGATVSGAQVHVPVLKAEATVFTVATGCDLPHLPCLAEADASASLYAENIDCQCLPGARVSIKLAVYAYGQAPSQSTVTVITASEVDRQTDSFTDPGNMSTTPLRIGAKQKFSVLITVGAVQQEQGSINGYTYDLSNLGFEISYKEFDPPGSTGTVPRADSDPTLDPSKGFDAIGGWYTTSSGATQGFEVLPNGTITAPIIAPNDNLHYTAPFGINNAGTIVGTYEKASGGINTFHGFMLSSGGAFSTYDVPFAGVSTGLQAINNNGDFTGDFGSSSQISQGFLNSGGNVTTFGVPGLNTYPQAMNDADTIVGIYLDANQNYQSFYRTVDGTLTTFDFPGAVSTHAEGINNASTINGYFTDTAAIRTGSSGHWVYSCSMTSAVRRAPLGEASTMRAP